MSRNRWSYFTDEVEYQSHREKIERICNRLRPVWIRHIFLNMPFPASFLIYFCLLTVNSKYVCYKSLPLTGFEPRTFDIGSDRSANWATTTTRSLNFFFKKNTFYATSYLPLSPFKVRPSSSWTLKFKPKLLSTQPKYFCFTMMARAQMCHLGNKVIITRSNEILFYVLNKMESSVTRLANFWQI